MGGSQRNKHDHARTITNPDVIVSETERRCCLTVVERCLGWFAIEFEVGDTIGQNIVEFGNELLDYPV